MSNEDRKTPNAERRTSNIECSNSEAYQIDFQPVTRHAGLTSMLDVRRWTLVGCPSIIHRLQSARSSLDCALLMAKMAWINRNERKRNTVKKYAALRAELKAKKDYAGLAQLPRDASPTRVVNRCLVTGRRRAFIRRFKISRLTFRELASQGLIPGVTKSSW